MAEPFQIIVTATPVPGHYQVSVQTTATDPELVQDALLTALQGLRQQARQAAASRLVQANGAQVGVGR